jgi:hypothetical protein
MNDQNSGNNNIPARVWAVGLGLGIFTTLLLRVLTATWPHSIEAGAVIAGLQLITFAVVRNKALQQSQQPKK